MHFPCSSVHISSLSSLPVCGKRMILWLRMKELNLVLSTQQNIWAAKSLSKPERAFSKLTFAWSSRLENEFFQLWAANANINTHITGCKEAALQYVFQTRLSFFVHSFCFWNLPSIFYIPNESHYRFALWRNSSPWTLEKAQIEPGNSRACNSVPEPAFSLWRDLDTYIQCCPGFLQEFLNLH